MSLKTASIDPSVYTPHAAVYVYDGDCVLCSRAVRYVLKHEVRPDVHFIAITSKQGRALATQFGIDPDDPDTFLFLKDGVGYTFSEAVFEMGNLVGGPLRFFRWARTIPLPLRDFIYARIANNRYRVFGKLDSCYVPSAETRTRFTLN